jgi:hypothetical protein
MTNQSPHTNNQASMTNFYRLSRVGTLAGFLGLCLWTGAWPLLVLAPLVMCWNEAAIRKYQQYDTVTWADLTEDERENYDWFTE